MIRHWNPSVIIWQSTTHSMHIERIIICGSLLLVARLLLELLLLMLLQGIPLLLMLLMLMLVNM